MTTSRQSFSYRLLRQKGVVAVTADGAAGDFVDVPFFDGTLRVPSGWAKLAAGTKSDILLICDKELTAQTRRRSVLQSRLAPRTVMRRLIRRLPPRFAFYGSGRKRNRGWHPWQRLRVDVDGDGIRRYSLKQYGFDETG